MKIRALHATDTMVKAVAVEFATHLSEDLLWSFAKRGHALDAARVRHTRDCRDCREFVSVFSEDARSTGLSFPELLPPVASSSG